ncbi:MULTISPECIES: hypothetical protein [unclassified Streptococcus]|uniref:hypothetical protein n=1 Tax=unclassified Streptococcus TaxID=2608887 RepID=UPI0010724BDB|nr:MULTISPECIES: hypothetical protein [unclassified Streptococcus]MBF0806569.1 hypothetical protein [Streptococcus sp. 19428wA2_WM07]TFU27372.1 hypothetical protein E4T71_07235 [Streptococcus sp. WM07]
MIHNPADFSRNRELSLDKTVNLILGMSGKSISKELLDADIWIAESAFVQARYKIKSNAFYKVFKEFTSKIPIDDSIPILAADGSDVNIPRNPADERQAVIEMMEVSPF